MYGYPASYVNPQPSNVHEWPKKIMTSFILDPILPPLNYLKYNQCINWNAAIEDGMSGSPVLSSDNIFMGIYSTKLALQTNTPLPHTIVATYGLFWNVFAIKTLLDKGEAVDWSKIK